MLHRPPKNQKQFTLPPSLMLVKGYRILLETYTSLLFYVA